MHISLVFLISFGIIVLVGVGIYFYIHRPPQIVPGKIENISFIERSDQWFISWEKPTTGSDPIGYIYVIQEVTVPRMITQGNTMDLMVTLDKSKYITANDYLLTIIPRNSAGDGPESSFLFTAPISS